MVEERRDSSEDEEEDEVEEEEERERWNWVWVDGLVGVGGRGDGREGRVVRLEFQFGFEEVGLGMEMVGRGPNTRWVTESRSSEDQLADNEEEGDATLG